MRLHTPPQRTAHLMHAPSPGTCPGMPCCHGYGKPVGNTHWGTPLLYHRECRCEAQRAIHAERPACCMTSRKQPSKQQQHSQRFAAAFQCQGTGAGDARFPHRAHACGLTAAGAAHPVASQPSMAACPWRLPVPRTQLRRTHVHADMHCNRSGMSSSPVPCIPSQGPVVGGRDKS